jgi:O-antigen/teichoic acid export membrane protein
VHRFTGFWARTVADEALLISVVVPAHDAAKTLDFCIDALMASDLPRSQWELIVVDDASTDETADAAKRADRVIRITGFPRGPAYARNRGAEAARAPILAFIDADIRVHSDTLRRLLYHLAEPELTAVFGSYDENPTDTAAHSQYRNLLHHYVHQRSGGETGSFWAGIGAIRAVDFRDAGMFDEVRYKKPQIEDVELGYRLRQRGKRIMLDPTIQGTHLKAWTLGGIVRTDLTQRGIPWVRLLLENAPGAAAKGPSLGLKDLASVGLVGLAAFLVVLWPITHRLEFAALSAISLALSIALSAPFHMWLWKTRGARVGLVSVPLYLLYHLTSVIAVVAGTVVFLLSDAEPILGTSGEVQPSRSFAGYAAGEAGSRMLAFIATAYIARRLGASAFGYLGFAAAVVAYFGKSLSTGISEIGSREVATRPADVQTIAAGRTLVRLGAAIIGVIAVVAVSTIVPEPPLGRLVLALTGLSLISIALDPSWVYKGMGRARPVGIALLGAQCIAVVLLLLLVRVPEDVVRVPLIQLFADLVAAGFLLAPLLGRAWLHPRLSEALHLVKSAGLITLSRTLRTLIVTIDVVMLGFMTTSEQVGLYSAAYRIVFFVMAIVYASHIAWLPPVTRAIAEGRSPNTAFSGALRLTLVVTVPFVVGGIMIATPLLRVIFGEEFTPAATALQLLLLSLFFIALHGASRNVFLAYDRLGVESWIMAAGVLVNVILNLILIPRFGLNGAAFATLAADGAILVLCAFAIAHFGVRPALRLLLVPLLAGSAMAVALWLIGVDRAAFVSIIVGGVVYAGALAALTRLSRDWWSSPPIASGTPA